jgi:predicted nuclease of predicted toxin-antitoxin system
MRILADMHISPETVRFLRELGHDAVRVNELLPANSPDSAIVKTARDSGRVILTQDLDFSELIAVSGDSQPSLISLRLSSSRIEYVNNILAKVLSGIEEDVKQGSIISVEDSRVRVRRLPF